MRAVSWPLCFFFFLSSFSTSFIPKLHHRRKWRTKPHSSSIVTEKRLADNKSIMTIKVHDIDGEEQEVNYVSTTLENEDHVKSEAPVGSLIQSRLLSTTTVKSLLISGDNNNKHENYAPFHFVVDPDWYKVQTMSISLEEKKYDGSPSKLEIGEPQTNVVEVKTLVWEVAMVDANINGDVNGAIQKQQQQQNEREIEKFRSKRKYIVSALRMDDKVDANLLEKIIVQDSYSSRILDGASLTIPSLVPKLVGLAPREVAEYLTGFESGTMAPMCHTMPMDLYVDSAILTAKESDVNTASMGSGSMGHSLIMKLKDMMKVARETSKSVRVCSFISQQQRSKTTPCLQSNPNKHKKGDESQPLQQQQQQENVRRRGQKQQYQQAQPKDRIAEYRTLPSLEERAKLLRSTVRKKGRYQEVKKLIQESISQNEFVDLMYVSADGLPAKNALHLAAWKGDYESVVFLVDTIQDQCPQLDIVNRVSTGIGSYGKTPIFYALTQCRDDVVRYLLDKGASLLFVNNKGQTPCSIAVSHLKEETCQFMYAIEKQQLKAGGTFVNYRDSHSDGKFYGDLDPRFPVDQDNAGEDIQDALATYQKSIIDTECYGGIPVSFSPRSLRPTTRWWNRDDKSLEAANLDTSGACITFTQPRPITPSKKKKQERKEVKRQQTQKQSLLQHRQLDSTPDIDVDSLEQLILDDVLLSSSSGENNDCTAPSQTYVADLEGIQKLAKAIDESIEAVEKNPNANVDDSLLLKAPWGLDCEWKPGLEFGKFSPVATLQLSTRYCSFLLDLQVLCRSSASSTSLEKVNLTVLEQTLSDVLSKLFGSSDIPILGYGVLQDLTKLAGSFPHLPCFSLYHSVIDLQSVSSYVYPNNTSRRGQRKGQQQCMSSLQKMVAILVGKRLDKTEQCSDWSRRPLTKEQMHYATLDAAVLPLLFQIMLEEPSFQVTHEGSFFQTNPLLRSSLRYTVLEDITDTKGMPQKDEEEPSLEYFVSHGTTKVSMSIRLARQSWPTGECPPELPKILERKSNTQSTPLVPGGSVLEEDLNPDVIDLVLPKKTKPPSKRRPPPVQLSTMASNLEDLPVPGTFLGYTKDSCVFRILGNDQISVLPEYTYIGFNRRSGIVETTNAWILFVNFGQRSKEEDKLDDTNSHPSTPPPPSTNLFNKFIAGGKQLNFTVKPKRVTEKSLIEYYLSSIDNEIGEKTSTEYKKARKAILLFARPSTRTKYIFCGKCECNRISTSPDYNDEGNGSVDMLLDLIDFPECVGQADYINAFGQSHVSLENQQALA